MVKKIREQTSKQQDDPLQVNERYLRDSDGEVGALLRAVTANPRGWIQYNNYADVVWKIAAICALYFRARVLIVASVEVYATELCWDLRRHLGDRVGQLTGQYAEPARCQVTTRAMLPHLGTGWHVLLPVVFNRRHLSEGACEALGRSKALRTITLTPRRLRLGQRTLLRLEALSGPLIYPSVGETTPEV